jgi:hypothetical protein
MRYAFAAAAFVATSVVIPPAVQTGAQSHMRYEPAPAGNEARYRVREQLAGFDVPSDAVGAQPTSRAPSCWTPRARWCPISRSS